MDAKLDVAALDTAWRPWAGERGYSDAPNQYLDCASYLARSHVRPRAAGVIRRISLGLQFFWRALPQISMEAILCRA